MTWSALGIFRENIKGPSQVSGTWTVMDPEPTERGGLDDIHFPAEEEHQPLTDNESNCASGLSQDPGTMGQETRISSEFLQEPAAGPQQDEVEDLEQEDISSTVTYVEQNPLGPTPLDSSNLGKDETESASVPGLEFFTRTASGLAAGSMVRRIFQYSLLVVKYSALVRNNCFTLATGEVQRHVKDQVKRELGIRCIHRLTQAPVMKHKQLRSYAEAFWQWNPHLHVKPSPLQTSLPSHRNDCQLPIVSSSCTHQAIGHHLLKQQPKLMASTMILR